MDTNLKGKVNKIIKINKLKVYFEIFVHELLLSFGFLQPVMVFSPINQFKD